MKKHKRISILCIMIAALLFLAACETAPPSFRMHIRFSNQEGVIGSFFRFIRQGIGGVEWDGTIYTVLPFGSNIIMVDVDEDTSTGWGDRSYVIETDWSSPVPGTTETRGEWATETTVFIFHERWDSSERIGQYGHLNRTMLMEFDMETKTVIRQLEFGRDEHLLTVVNEIVYFFSQGRIYARPLNDPGNIIELESVGSLPERPPELLFWIYEDGIAVQRWHNRETLMRVEYLR